MAALSEAERARVQEYLAAAGDRILSVVKALSPGQLRFRPRHDRWSISENVEHLSIVDRLVLGQIVEIIAIDGHRKESAWKGREDLLLEQVRRREPALKAPEIIAPRAQVQPDEIVQQFESARSHISQFIQSTRAPLRSYCFPHPVFGDLDCYQWLLCSGAHYERHLQQINEVKESPDFPRMPG
jgi:hypothetical protein